MRKEKEELMRARNESKEREGKEIINKKKEGFSNKRDSLKWPRNDISNK